MPLTATNSLKHYFNVRLYISTPIDKPVTVANNVRKRFLCRDVAELT